MKNYFATNLRYLRKQKKLRQAELAVVIRKSGATVSAWEREFREPLLEDVYVLSKFFGVSIEELCFMDLRK